MKTVFTSRRVPSESMSNAPESNLKSFEAEASHSFGKRESTGDPDQTQVSTVMGMKAQLE